MTKLRGGRERTVFFTSGWGKLSYSTFSLVLYSARCMLGVESVQFSLQGRKVKLQHFLSRTLFGTLYVRGKERTVFLPSGYGKLSYSIFSLVLYSARCMLGVESVQFCFRSG